MLTTSATVNVALDNFASANAFCVDPILETKRRIEEYVRKRLREEARARGRGGQAWLAKQLKIEAPHLSNIISDTHSRNPGDYVIRSAARHWGITPAQLEAEALGHTAEGSWETPADRGAQMARLARIPQEVIDRTLEREKERLAEAEEDAWYSAIREEYIRTMRDLMARSPLGKTPATKREKPDGTKRESAQKPNEAAPASKRGGRRKAATG